MVGVGPVVLLLSIMFSCGSANDDVSCQIETVTIDRHLFRNSMSSSIRPTLGWSISPSCGNNPQTSFAVALADAKGRLLWLSSPILSNRSNSVSHSNWMKNANKPEYPLKHGTEYQISVAVTLAGEKQLPWSKPATFVTRLSSTQVYIHIHPRVDNCKHARI